MSKPALQSPVPDLTVTIIGGSHPEPVTMKFSTLRDKLLVLYFYPKDDTPGCTTQACGLRDGWDSIAARAHVLGVSVDSVKSHQKFIQKHGLPFPLIADEDHQVVEAFGVWVEKSMYGKTYMGTERSTFIIGTDGTIQAILEKVKPDEHLDLVLSHL